MKADPQRYDHLLGCLLDGELTTDEAEELKLILQANPDQRRELRHHLELWELFSQEQAPERSADAFLASVHTRLKAEDEGETFLAGLKTRLDSADREHHTHQYRLRPLSLAWAGIAASLVFAALLGLLWIMNPGQAGATPVEMHGEAVCRACILHEIEEHRPAFLVHNEDGTHTYHVHPDRDVIAQMGDFCSAPVPMAVTGMATETGEHFALAVTTVEIDAPPKIPKEERILFPF